MRQFLQKAGNALLIVGGFLVVFFGVQKATDQSSIGAALSNVFLTGDDVVHADAPSSGDASCGGDSGGPGDSACADGDGSGGDASDSGCADGADGGSGG
jgi:hypothetical protein